MCKRHLVVTTFANGRTSVGIGYVSVLKTPTSLLAHRLHTPTVYLIQETRNGYALAR